MARIDGYRAPIRTDCPVQPISRLENDAEIAVPVRLIRHERNASLNERKSFLVSSLLMRKHARKVQRTGMIGCRLEYAAVELVGLNELPVFLQGIATETASSSVNSRVDDTDDSMSYPGGPPPASGQMPSC